METQPLSDSPPVAFWQPSCCVMVASVQPLHRNPQIYFLQLKSNLLNWHVKLYLDSLREFLKRLRHGLLAGPHRILCFPLKASPLHCHSQPISWSSPQSAATPHHTRWFNHPCRPLCSSLPDCSSEVLDTPACFLRLTCCCWVTRKGFLISVVFFRCLQKRNFWICFLLEEDSSFGFWLWFFSKRRFFGFGPFCVRLHFVAWPWIKVCVFTDLPCCMLHFWPNRSCLRLTWVTIWWQGDNRWELR